MSLIDPIFLFLRWKVKINFIVEPYAMHKGCPYGYSIFFLVFFSLFILSSLHRRDRGTFILLYHQGNDSSTR